jgi:N-methylhydantoinase A
VRVRHELRYRGQSFELGVEEELESSNGSRPMEPEDLHAAFARAHESRYGYGDEGAGIELVNMRASVWGRAPALQPAAANGAATAARAVRTVLFDGEGLETVVLRGELAPGTVLDGPTLCALPESTLLVPPGWRGEVDAQGTVHLNRTEGD